MNPYQNVLDTVRERTSPEPDGIQDARSNCWTSTEKLRYDAGKTNSKLPEGQVHEIVSELAANGDLFTWHGLVAPTTDDHLAALIENEELASDWGGRRILKDQARNLQGETAVPQEGSA